MTDSSLSGPVTGMYELVGAGFFLQPTPAGAYYAVGNPELNAERYLLLNLMSSPASRRATAQRPRAWTGQHTDQEALAVVYRAQERGWVEGFRQPQGPPPGALEPIADRCLLNLSSTGHGLLSDAQGFCIASRGFDSDGQRLPRRGQRRHRLDAPAALALSGQCLRHLHRRLGDGRHGRQQQGRVLAAVRRRAPLRPRPRRAAGAQPPGAGGDRVGPDHPLRRDGCRMPLCRSERTCHERGSAEEHPRTTQRHFGRHPGLGGDLHGRPDDGRTAATRASTKTGWAR